MIKDEIFPPQDLRACVDCIRGKLTKVKKYTSSKRQKLLELIHTYICGPYLTTLCGNTYFITFIYDYSKYGYGFLIEEKSNAFEKFNV